MRESSGRSRFRPGRGENRAMRASERSVLTAREHRSAVARDLQPAWAEPQPARKWGASVARCPPYRWNPLLLPGAARTALKPCNLFPEGRQLRSNRECFVIVSTCGFDRFYGSIRPGKNIAFEHTSILVRPRQSPSEAGILVEPPGTAPGSAASIMRHHLSP